MAVHTLNILAYDTILLNLEAFILQTLSIHPLHHIMILKRLSDLLIFGEYLASVAQLAWYDRNSDFFSYRFRAYDFSILRILKIDH